MNDLDTRYDNLIKHPEDREFISQAYPVLWDMIKPPATLRKDKQTAVEKMNEIGKMVMDYLKQGSMMNWSNLENGNAVANALIIMLQRSFQEEYGEMSRAADANDILIKLADRLDQMGLINEADEIDKLIQ